MRWNILRAGAVIGLALLAISLLLIGKPLAHKLVVKSYFTDANGLRSGAAVRLAGLISGRSRVFVSDRNRRMRQLK